MSEFLAWLNWNTFRFGWRQIVKRRDCFNPRFITEVWEHKRTNTLAQIEYWDHV